MPVDSISISDTCVRVARHCTVQKATSRHCTVQKATCAAAHSASNFIHALATVPCRFVGQPVPGPRACRQPLWVACCRPAICASSRAPLPRRPITARATHPLSDRIERVERVWLGWQAPPFKGAASLYLVCIVQRCKGDACRLSPFQQSPDRLTSQHIVG